MKTLLTALLISACALTARAQPMQVKKYNFTTFTKQERASPAILIKNSSPESKNHPEFGILPYNATCNNCVELIDKRTANSRFFIDAQNEKHSWSQGSYFPLHYKNSGNDVWHTINPLLQPTATAGVYTAPQQPNPTRCDLTNQLTSIKVGDFEFEFNRGLSMFFYDENNAYTQKLPANYNNYTVGAEGALVKNVWPGINMEQVFGTGEIETNYTISAPLQIPINTGWMVIEDHFTLPEGYTFEQAQPNWEQQQGYRGDYVIKNKDGVHLITYKKAVYLDARAYGMAGVYRLLKSGNSYTLQLHVPVEWLKRTDLTYPLLIDPTVYGTTKMGSYRMDSLATANLGFTSLSLGSCDYHMFVAVPGKSTITKAYSSFEYQLTYDNTCGGDTPLPAPFCTFSQVSMEVVCDSCHTSTGLLGCNPNAPPFTGTCTTDSNLVTGVRPILINSFNPNYLSCYSPQCPDYFIPFTLKNRDSICGDVCGYLCARGNLWQMSIEAEQMDPSPGIIVNGDSLISPSPGNNQWYYFGQLIPGATAQVYVTTQPGIYTVMFTDTGIQCSSTAYLPDSACQAWFSAYQAPGDSGRYFGYNQSLYTGAASCLWDFGDGSTSTDFYPHHQYAQPGIYNVCLTIFDSTYNCSSTHCDSSFYVFKTQGGLMSELNIVNPTVNGINDLPGNLAANIYPNPANNTLTFNLGGLQADLVKIFSSTGNLVLQQKSLPGNTINVALLPPGVYLAQVWAQGKSATLRWIKM